VAKWRTICHSANTDNLAIGLCFSMTTVFRSDILATSLSRILDQTQTITIPSTNHPNPVSSNTTETTDSVPVPVPVTQPTHTQTIIQPVPLPPILLRTIIQTLKTYKSLLPFIANSILPKLIQRKVWENPPLWDGFLIVVKIMGSASFGGLMQLPREKLKEVVERVGGIGEGLKGYLKGRGMGGAFAEVS
jgi:symplekin